jgi:hypothetical protein
VVSSFALLLLFIMELTNIFPILISEKVRAHPIRQQTQHRGQNQQRCLHWTNNRPRRRRIIIDQLGLGNGLRPANRWRDGLEAAEDSRSQRWCDEWWWWSNQMPKMMMIKPNVISQNIVVVQMCYSNMFYCSRYFSHSLFPSLLLCFDVKSYCV